MFKTIKNQKGITLVELLAVMVIVGIIAAISIPAIGNLIENTRQDAFIATAQNVTEAARLVVAQESKTCDDANGCTISFGIESTGANNIVGNDNIEKLATGTTATVTYTGTGTDNPATYTIEIEDARYSYSGDAFKAVRATGSTPPTTNEITVK